MSWFEENPALLQDELSHLAAHHLEFEVNEKARLSGKLIVDVKLPVDGRVLELTCCFPEDYPYFPFEIICQNFPPGRHLEPSSKVLCLFLDKNNSWNISSDNLGDVITSRVLDIYQSHMNPDEISESEDLYDGYQISGQLQVDRSSVILLNSDQKLDEDAGTGTLIVNSVCQPKERFFGCVGSLFNKANKNLYSDTSNLPQQFDKKIPFRWIKLNSPLKHTDVTGVLGQVLGEYPHLKTPKYAEIRRFRFEIIGVCFQEETSRGEIDNNWVFIMRAPNKGAGNTHVCKLIRSDHIHPTYSFSRTPSLVGLSDKTVAIIGTGALGSTVVSQLARGGVKNLKLVDQDFLQVGNLSRWSPALPYVGRPKVEVLSDILKSNYLDLNVETYQFEIGNAFDDYAKLLREKVLHNCDLVIDCTAQLNVNQYLSQLCHKTGIDYVWCSATNGARGGIVGKYSKDQTTDVWFDFNSRYGDKEIEPAEAEDSDLVQPKGCFHPTFTGTGFDLDTISIMATRVSVSLLQGEVYGKFNFDVAVLDQWKEGRPSVPRWREYRFSD